jgi:hypothetical protein
MPSSPKFWSYFLAVEADLAACSRYVEFSEANYGAFSNEFAKILVIAGSEIDAILRELCSKIEPKVKAGNILQYQPVISKHFTYFPRCEVEIPTHGLRLAPWSGWSSTSSPSWWGEGFNKVKHDRSDSFQSANMLNALNAVGALFLAILHYHYQSTNAPFRIAFDQGNRLFQPARAADDHGGAYWNYGLPWAHLIQGGVA